MPDWAYSGEDRPALPMGTQANANGYQQWNSQASGFVEFGGEVMDNGWAAVRNYIEQCRNQGSACLVGLDLEWPSDRPGSNDNNPVALIQIATPEAVALVRVDPKRLQVPQWVVDLLRGPAVVKCVAGFDVLDRHKLATLGIQCSCLLDVAVLAEELADRVPSIGLRKLCHFFGYPIRKPKHLALSNWAQATLEPDQKQYAADDAFFTLVIAGHLLEASPYSAFRERCLDAWMRLKPRLCGNIRQVAAPGQDLSQGQWTHLDLPVSEKASQYAVSEASTCDTGYDQSFYSWGEWSPLYDPPVMQNQGYHQPPTHAVSYGFGNGDLFTAQDYENTCAASAGMWVDNSAALAWY